MQIAKLFFIIITGATLAGNASAEDTDLHSAAWDNNVAEAKQLIDSGAEINAKDEDGYTPLHRAAFKNAAAAVKLLIDSGAEINAKDNNGATPLSWTAQENAAAVAKVLIDNGAEIQAQDNDGDTPLHWTAQNNAAACWLGGDQYEKQCYTPLHNAAFGNDGGRNACQCGDPGASWIRLCIGRGKTRRRLRDPD